MKVRVVLKSSTNNTVAVLGMSLKIGWRWVEVRDSKGFTIYSVPRDNVAYIEKARPNERFH